MYLKSRITETDRELESMSERETKKGLSSAGSVRKTVHSVLARRHRKPEKQEANS